MILKTSESKAVAVTVMYEALQVTKKAVIEVGALED